MKTFMLFFFFFLFSIINFLYSIWQETQPIIKVNQLI